MTKTREGFEELGRTLVRIRRSVSEDPLDGFVLDRGREWLLISAVDDSCSPDGYSVVRSSHVTEMQDRGPTARFARKYLELCGEWPPQPPGFALNLNNTAGLVTILSGQGMAIEVYIEEEDPDVLFVGVPFLSTDGLGLREIDAGGSWRGEDSEWEVERITQIRFGSRYTTHMLEVAERCPPEL
jgi:hypothetical protein